MTPYVPNSFRRLLVPIAGDAASSVAIEYAIEIARARTGELTFLYALDMRALGMGGSLWIDPGWINLLRPDAERIGQAALARAAAAECSATLEVVAGLAEEVVLRLAASFDLVVMGTRGFSGISHLLDHSVTDAVVRACAPPVLVVREGERVPATSGKTIVVRRLIVPIDGSVPAQGAVDIASVLGSDPGRELIFVHAVDPARAVAFSGPQAPEKSGAYEVMRSYATTLLENAARAARSAGASNVGTRLIVGNPAEAILSAVSNEKGDAIVIGTHGRQGFDRAIHRSLTEQILRISPVPVLTAHASAINHHRGRA